jgi:hypothetical protein
MIKELFRMITCQMGLKWKAKCYKIDWCQRRGLVGKSVNILWDPESIWISLVDFKINPLKLKSEDKLF